LILSQLMIITFGLSNISLAFPIVRAIKLYHINLLLVNIHDIHCDLINLDHILKKTPITMQKINENRSK